MKVINSPNTVFKNRSEGNAKTYKGLFGINAIEDITKDSGKKIAIWGNSYIEAHQVNDQDKIPQVVTAKLATKGLREKLSCFGVGMSGNKIADYYFDIPKYEKLTTNIISHYIIITDIKDTLPDQSSDKCWRCFKSNPFTFYQNGWKPKHQKIKTILNNYHFYFIWKPVKSALISASNLHFTPSIKKQDSKGNDLKEEEYSDKFLSDSWSFLFKKVLEQTELPIVIIYCPAVPKIYSGRISVKNNYANHMELFAEIAKEHNISVLNASDAFISFYERTGMFPRGFSNSQPSEGHFNKYGHEIVSEIITTYITTVNKL